MYRGRIYDCTHVYGNILLLVEMILMTEEIKLNKKPILKLKFSLQQKKEKIENELELYKLLAAYLIFCSLFWISSLSLFSTFF